METIWLMIGCYVNSNYGYQWGRSDMERLDYTKL